MQRDPSPLGADPGDSESWIIDADGHVVEPDDIWPTHYETSTDDPDSMRRYLDWEIALLDSVDLSELTALRSG